MQRYTENTRAHAAVNAHCTLVEQEKAWMFPVSTGALEHETRVTFVRSLLVFTASSVTVCGSEAQQEWKRGSFIHL